MSNEVCALQGEENGAVALRPFLPSFYGHRTSNKRLDMGPLISFSVAVNQVRKVIQPSLPSYQGREEKLFL